MTLALPSGQTMETITPIPLTRLKIPNAPPEAAPENPREGFAQEMARQKKFRRSQENPVGLDREGVARKTSLTPEEKSKRENRDQANDPAVTSALTTPISNAVLSSPLNRLEEPPLEPETQSPNPDLASTVQNGFVSRILPGPGDFHILGETGPVFAPAPVQPEGTLKENPVVSKAFEDLILYTAPGSLPYDQKASAITTEMTLRSSQTTTENGPSFSPQGPAIPETTPIVDGLDPSPSLILREAALKARISETPTLELKPDSQAPPLEALSRTEKAATAPLLEGPPLAAASPMEANSQALKISALAASPEPSKEILSDRGISSSASLESRPAPEKTSPTLAGPGPEPSSLHQAPLDKVEPGSALRDPGENLAGSAEQEQNNLFRVQGDRHQGILTDFPGQPRIDGIPADRSVEGPPKGSPEWVQEAQSVFHQFSKGLLRTLQHSGERIQMSLDPPQLGNILLEITRDRNFVTAHLWTDNPLTKELLDFSQGQLQKTLELDGFKLDRFEVLVQPDLKSFQEERWFGGRQPSGENSREGGRRFSSEGLILTAPETATLRFSRGNQYVDTWV